MCTYMHTILLLLFSLLLEINAGDLAVVQPVLDITEYQKRKQVNEETHNDGN